MQAPKPAIKLAPLGNGWSWTFFDSRGSMAAAGLEKEQVTAMQSAWRAARSVSRKPFVSFPEIIVEQGRGDW